MSETLNLKPNARALNAFLVPSVPGLMGSGVSTRSTTAYLRGPIAGSVGGAVAGSAVVGGPVAGGTVATECVERAATALVAVKTRTSQSPVFIAPGADAQLFGQQNTQLHTMWALRGLDPWSQPT